MLNVTIQFNGTKVAADLKKEIDQSVRLISNDYFGLTRHQSKLVVLEKVGG
mgnify:CR=1 FL=1